MDVVISPAAREGREKDDGRQEAEPREVEKGQRRKQKESIVTTRLNFMNIIFQQMSWTIGRRRRRRRN